MAKRKASRRGKSNSSGRRRQAVRRSGKRPIAKRSAKRPTSRTKPARARRAKPTPKPKAGPRKTPRLDRQRRTLDETIPTPPSSLDLDRHGSAARSGRKELGDNLLRHGMINPALTGGDVDADWEGAYFNGDEAPGGDNPTPDQDVVDDIGKALGVQYDDNEELKAADKVVERDKHRWELDPASAEDYKERK
jgi:uncharacterized protein DUF6335